ncbi:MAG: DUF4136 domain-containing protein [Candidatus Latescibacterota bacterium]|nr:MAG: DUF4136 domain-containing protein [Candidatus Latescibacterota bacterium]
MAIPRLVVFLLLAALAVGCSKSKEVNRILESPIIVEAAVEEDADFSKYETWTWLEVLANVQVDPRIDNPEFTSNVDNAVEREMYTRGYRKDKAAPDLLVNGHAVFEEIDKDYIAEQYDGSYYPEYQTDISEGDKQKAKWEEGSIILFFFDAKTRMLVYQASAKAEVTDPKYTTPQQRQARIDNAIAQMMAKFPRR